MLLQNDEQRTLPLLDLSVDETDFPASVGLHIGNRAPTSPAPKPSSIEILLMSLALPLRLPTQKSVDQQELPAEDWPPISRHGLQENLLYGNP